MCRPFIARCGAIDDQLSTGEAVIREFALGGVHRDDTVTTTLQLVRRYDILIVVRRGSRWPRRRGAREFDERRHLVMR